MEAQKLELLESRVLKAIDEISRLREDNTKLKAQLEEQQKQVADKEKEISALNRETHQLEEWSVKNQQLLQERDEIRFKVESLLDKLEKIDII